MRRVRFDERPGWRDQVVADGLIYLPTVLPDGPTRDYWNEGVAYAFEVVPEEMLILASELGTGAARELSHTFERENIRTVMDAELWRRTVA